MKFFTIATHNERTLDILKESAIKNNIKLDIIGQGKVFKNYGIKLIWFLEYLEDIDDNELVVFLDGFDTILLTGENEFKEQFNEINDAEPDKKKKGLIFSNGKSYLRFNALLEVNSGLVMGYAKKFKQILKSICSKYKCDKHGSCDVLLERFKRNFIIDDSSDLFHNFYLDGKHRKLFMKTEKIKEVSIINNRVKIFKNNRARFPCAIHFPKKSYNLDIINKLGYYYDVNDKRFNSSEKYIIFDFLKHYNMYIVKYYVLALLLFIVYKLHSRNK